MGEEERLTFFAASDGERPVELVVVADRRGEVAGVVSDGTGWWNAHARRTPEGRLALSGDGPGLTEVGAEDVATIATGWGRPVPSVDDVFTICANQPLRFLVGFRDDGDPAELLVVSDVPGREPRALTAAWFSGRARPWTRAPIRRDEDGGFMISSHFPLTGVSPAQATAIAHEHFKRSLPQSDHEFSLAHERGASGDVFALDIHAAHLPGAPAAPLYPAEMPAMSYRLGDDGSVVVIATSPGLQRIAIGYSGDDSGWRPAVILGDGDGGQPLGSRGSWLDEFDELLRTSRPVDAETAAAAGSRRRTPLLLPSAEEMRAVISIRDIGSLVPARSGGAPYFVADIPDPVPQEPQTVLTLTAGPAGIEAGSRTFQPDRLRDVVALVPRGTTVAAASADYVDKRWAARDAVVAGGRVMFVGEMSREYRPVPVSDAASAIHEMGIKRVPSALDVRVVARSRLLRLAREIKTARQYGFLPF